MKYIFTTLMFGIVLTGCAGDAPHDNPLDPLSPAFISEGNIHGRIIVANQSKGVSGATVIEMEHQQVTTTDSSGNFSFTNLSSGSHQFICTKENFTADTFTVEIETGTTDQITRYMNGAPVVLMQQILTRKIDQYFPGVQYFVDIAATVTDPNSTDPNGVNDLDSVWFSVDTLMFPLTYSPSTKIFIATIYKSKFPTNTIQWLVGKPLTIVSRDQHHSTNISTPFFVARVIENTAVPTKPSSLNNDTVAVWSNLKFYWTPPGVAFNYTYTLTLSVVNAGTQSVVWNLPGISSQKENFLYTADTNADSLTSGNYLWTISVVDDFGNYSRSKESSFVIK